MPSHRHRREASEPENLTPKALARWEWVLWIALYLVLCAWALHWLWGSAVTPGVDTGGHLTRLDAAWKAFSVGRIDGWFDQVSLGYQMHLLYGPGFALIVSLLRALSFGVVSTAGAYKLTAILATVAIPFTGMTLGRVLRLKPRVAWLAGALMLVVSSPFSSGLEGAFTMGLMPQQVAAPMVLGAWALTISRRQRPLVLGLLVGLLTITHPYSVVMYMSFGIFLLVAARLDGHPIAWPQLSKAAGVAVISVAWWWIPALAGRDLRGPLTGWVNPDFVEHLRLVASGERGIAYPVSALVVLAIGFIIVQALHRRDVGLGALAVLPVAVLGSLHLFVFLAKSSIPEAILFPNRGLTFAAYLAMPATALALSRLSRIGPVVVAVFVVIALPGLKPPPSFYYQPTAELEATAADLSAIVPSGYRFAYAELPMIGFGTPAPSRYLGWRSGTADLTIFGSEWAPGSEVSQLVYKKLDQANIDDWLNSIGQYRVSHIISATPEVAKLFERENSLTLVSTHGDLQIWAITAPRPIEVVEATANKLVFRVQSAIEADILLPVGYSPGWHATGHDLGRSNNGQLTVFDVSSGDVISLRWRMPVIHTIGWLTTWVGATVLVMVWMQSSRVVERQTRRWQRQLHHDE